MPHVEIECYPGRNDEQKRECAEKIAEVMAQTLGCKASSVSVSFSDVAPEDWKEKVWDAKIKPNMDSLSKKPGYTCE